MARGVCGRMGLNAWARATLQGGFDGLMFIIAWASLHGHRDRLHDRVGGGMGFASWALLSGGCTPRFACCMAAACICCTGSGGSVLTQGGAMSHAA